MCWILLHRESLKEWQQARDLADPGDEWDSFFEQVALGLVATVLLVPATVEKLVERGSRLDQIEADRRGDSAVQLLD